jgi:hypothetical protein
MGNRSVIREHLEAIDEQDRQRRHYVVGDEKGDVVGYGAVEVCRLLLSLRRLSAAQPRMLRYAQLRWATQHGVETTQAVPGGSLVSIRHSLRSRLLNRGSPHSLSSYVCSMFKNVGHDSRQDIQQV